MLYYFKKKGRQFIPSVMLATVCLLLYIVIIRLKKEALTLISSVERLKCYLLGRDFDLMTNHKPLEVIFGICSNSVPE